MRAVEHPALAKQPHANPRTLALADLRAQLDQQRLNLETAFA